MKTLILFVFIGLMTGCGKPPVQKPSIPKVNASGPVLLVPETRSSGFDLTSEQALAIRTILLSKPVWRQPDVGIPDAPLARLRIDGNLFGVYEDSLTFPEFASNRWVWKSEAITRMYQRLIDGADPITDQKWKDALRELESH